MEEREIQICVFTLLLARFLSPEYPCDKVLHNLKRYIRKMSCQSQEPGTYANEYQGKNSFFHACNTQYTAAGCNGKSYSETAFGAFALQSN